MGTEQTVMTLRGYMTTSGVDRFLGKGGDHPFCPRSKFVFSNYIFPGANGFQIKIKGSDMNTEQTSMALWGCITTSGVARGLEKGATTRFCPLIQICDF